MAAALAALTAALGLACSLFGPISVAEATQWQLWQSIVWQDRISRIVAAGIAGGGLSLAGLTLQALLRNPLADPYILGISSGAGVGVIAGLAVVSRSGLPWFATTPTLAFAGAIATCVAVYGVSQRRGHIDAYSLILSGVMLNTINGAVILAIYLFIDPHTLVSFVGWSIGQVPDGVPIPNLAICGACSIAAGVWVLLRGAAFNTLTLGDTVAASVGVPLGRLRFEAFAAAGLVTACAVALVGPIGFVGLFIPHICRMILGPDHRRLAVACAFGGAIFLIACDTLCRFVGLAADLGKFPVGIVTAFLGGPFFLWLLRKRHWTSMP